MNMEIKSLWAMSHDGDNWGQCMSFHFAIAGTIYRNDGNVPAEWQYKPGLFTYEPPKEWPDNEIETMLTDNDVTMPELIEAGNIFSRYSDILKAQGQDY